MANNPLVADMLKECPVCFRLAPLGEYAADLRCRDGMARRCGQCQQRRDGRSKTRSRLYAAMRHERWRRSPRNRLKRLIWWRMWHYAGETLTPWQALLIYGPKELKTRPERVEWLIKHQPITNQRGLKFKLLQ